MAASPFRGDAAAYYFGNLDSWFVHKRLFTRFFLFTEWYHHRYVFRMDPLYSSYRQTHRVPPIARHWSHIGTAVAVSALALGIVATYAAWRYEFFSSATVEPARGFIFLTLAQATSTKPAAYVFDITERRLDAARSLGMFVSMAAQSPKLVTVSTLANPPGGVYVYDKNTNEAREIVASGAIRAFPRLSPDGSKVVYVALSSRDADRFVADKHRIFIAEEGVEPQEIAFGTYPHWSPDGSSVLYVGGDGLHLFDTKSGNDLRVVPIERGVASARMMLDVSDDGAMLAWTNPMHGEIAIMAIESWKPFSARVSERIPVHAFWPVISPDNSRVAYEEVDWAPIPENPRLVIYNLTSNIPETVADLSAYNQMSMFMSEWTY